MLLKSRDGTARSYEQRRLTARSVCGDLNVPPQKYRRQLAARTHTHTHHPIILTVYTCTGHRIRNTHYARVPTHLCVL